MKSPTNSVIRDLFSYIVVYCPEFPPEDQLSVKDVFTRLMDAMKIRLERGDPTGALTLSLSEVESAYAAFTRGDDDAGSRHIQIAESHFKQFASGVKTRVRFVASADGTIEKVDGQ